MSRLPAWRTFGPEEIRRVFEESTGTWTGCDWHTTFGKFGLDLHGWTAAGAKAMAAEAKETAEGEEWQAAAKWLAQIEAVVEQAENRALGAVRAVAMGEWENALRLAEQAWRLEFSTGRPLRRGLPFCWQPLWQTIEGSFVISTFKEEKASRCCR
jgi:hypothetical protein